LLRGKWLEGGGAKEKHELNERHHASLVEADTEADVGEARVAWEVDTGHNSGHKQMDARRQESSSDEALSQRALHVPLVALLSLLNFCSRLLEDSVWFHNGLANVVANGEQCEGSDCLRPQGINLEVSLILVD